MLRINRYNIRKNLKKQQNFVYGIDGFRSSSWPEYVQPCDRKYQVKDEDERKEKAFVVVNLRTFSRGKDGVMFPRFAILRSLKKFIHKTTLKRY